MVKKVLLWAALIIGSPSLAREWGSAGGWDITEVDAETCVMAMEFDGEGSTLLGLLLKVDGRVSLVVSNHNWSSKRGEAYHLVYVLKGTTYSGGKSVGTQVGIRNGFATVFEPDFAQAFAASTFLTIRSKDGVLIDDLSLAGSAAGLAQVRRCVAHLKAAAATEAREKARFAHIPKDPFASVQGEPLPSAPRVQTAKAKGNITSLVSDEDYPAAAVRAGEEGTTGFRLDVSPNGRVTNCTVTSSSGSSALDSATCRIIRSRARFTPATDSAGNPTTDTVIDRITWKLPTDGG